MILVVWLLSGWHLCARVASSERRLCTVDDRLPTGLVEAFQLCLPRGVLPTTAALVLAAGGFGTGGVVLCFELSSKIKNPVVSPMDIKRMEEWVQLSHRVAALFPANTPGQHGSVITLQQLARFEDDIDKMQEEYNAKCLQKIPEQPREFDRIVAYEYLWVLGAYEITRVLAQKTGNKDLIEAKEKFARLRVPLAKLEASKKHADTDYVFPLLTLIQGTFSPGWVISPTLVITRKGLSDDLLGSLKKFTSASTSTSNV